MSGPPRVEKAVNLAEELAIVSQKYDMNVNKLKRQKVWNCSYKIFAKLCSFLFCVCDNCPGTEGFNFFILSMIMIIIIIIIIITIIF